ncbi:MAG: SusC/RagA family protein, partial [Muribaculaceae bacterium]|nr:SusC/RagA family protein [Muribaculaceae bacterium]
ADGSWIYKEGVADQTGLQKGTFVYGPGDIKFKDLKADGVIDGGKGTADDHGDLKVIGNTQPRYQYSFHIGGDWKGFDLDLYFQGVGKREMWTTSAFVMPLMRGADGTYDHMESYNKMIFDAEGNITGYEVNQDNTYPCMYPGNESKGTVSGISAGNNNFYPQSRYLVDMSYLRLKNITFGYTVPQVWTRKAYIEKARVYFSADNIATPYRGNKGLPLDPEMNAGSGNSWGRTTPIAKTFSCGLQVTF